MEREEAMTFEAVAEQWFEKEYSDCPPKTPEKIRWHLRILNQHIDKIPFSRLERRDIVEAIVSYTGARLY
ncbi:hypothetical protein AGMMS49925_11620 [Deltaproteobacteria bacterium]|nr:hypothetical protein AGMMS49925_11620 [Deltaproteobacteria bacterium]